MNLYIQINEFFPNNKTNNMLSAFSNISENIMSNSYSQLFVAPQQTFSMTTVQKIY